MAKVLISDDMSPLAAEIFCEAAVEVDIKTGLKKDQLLEIIGNYDGLVIRSSTKVDQDVLNAATKLKIIGRAGIGVDNVDIPAATARGVIVENTPFGNSVTTAEHAIAMIMSLARQIPVANASTQAGKWEKTRFMGVEVTGKTLGIIGCGNIGAIVADRARGLKMTVLAFDPFLTEQRANELSITKSTLDELLENSDFITLHTPLNDKTRNIIDRTAISKMKHGSYIINCARGGLVVESDLAEAIKSGKIAGAGLDVFETEPARENLLFGMDQVIATPHLGASTNEAQEKVALQVAEQLAAYFAKGTIINSVNTAALSEEDSKKLKPYIELAQNLASLASQLVSGAISKIAITYQGAAAKLNTRPITAEILCKIIKPFAESVNIINASAICLERSIEVTELKKEQAGDYKTSIDITITTNDEEQHVSGTLFDDCSARVTAVNYIKLEASLEGYMLFVMNEDRPGLIGSLGTLLSKAGINIANFHLGRNAKGSGSAICLVALDDELSPELLDDINSLAHVKRAVGLLFGF